MASSSSRIYNPSRKFCVFVSFRGEDTRNNFVSHLYEALKKSGIDTFKDDERLEKGVSLKPGLFEAIQQSELSIIVLSNNYAASTWCLEELSKILECYEFCGQKVVPVFYNVNPSDVRNQKGSFANAFAKHEEKFKHDKENVKKWKKALHKVANISGHNSRGRDDSRLIKEIIDDISYKIFRMQSVASGLVGMSLIMEKIVKLLELGSNDVRMVGICGMPGIGKTTIAEVMFERISSQFEARCFLHKVKEEFHKNNGSVVLLQEKLLSKISQISKISLDTEIEGRQQLQNRFSHRKILIAVDDVDDSKQLQELVGSCDWFGSGSRIIITTRDRHLLVQHDVQLIYEARELNNEDAIQLFCQHAFKEKHSTSKLQDLSKQIVGYCQGLPLALKVLGSLMHGRWRSCEWEDEIKKLKRSPDLGIQIVLKSCVDGLDDRQKELFLDIACFFNGRCKTLVEKILHALTIDMSKLVDRFLITIVQEYDTDHEEYVEVIRMHDLLQEMGREIIRQESKGKLENQGRFFDYEDVRNLFTTNKSADKIKGISIYLDKAKDGLEDIHAYLNALGAMGSRFLPHGLRHLHWHGCPFSRLSSKSDFENLAVLEIVHSPIKRLWKGAKCLGNLFILDLSYCQNLEKVPNLSGAPNLEKLILKGCSNLAEVHWSVGHLNKLKILNFEGCSKLKKHPWLNGYKGSCRTHIPSYLIKLNKIPRTSTKTKCLTRLCLDGTSIKELSSAIRNLQSLEFLSLKDCSRLEILTNDICKLKSLKKLHLQECSKLSAFPDLPETMPNLQELRLDKTSITTLPNSICKLQSLESLDLTGCLRFAIMPETMCSMTALSFLSLCGTAIKSLPSIEGYYRTLPSIEECNRTLQRLQGNLSNSLQRYQEILRNHCSEMGHSSYVLQRLSNSESNLKGILAELEIILNRLPSPWQPTPLFLYSFQVEGFSKIRIRLSFSPFSNQVIELQFKGCNRWEVLRLNGMFQIERIIRTTSSPNERIWVLSLEFEEYVKRMLQIFSDLVDQSVFESAENALEAFLDCILSSSQSQEFGD